MKDLRNFTSCSILALSLSAAAIAVSAPAVAITTPAYDAIFKQFPVLSGTATDNGGPGIAGNLVDFTLQHVTTNQYWNGSAWGNPTVQLSAALDVNTNVWSYSGQLPNDSDGSLRTGQYFMSAFTYDNNSVVSPPVFHVNNISFTVDISPPATLVVAPANGSPLTIASYSFNGTITDNDAVDYVIPFIRRVSDGFYWDGATWVSDVLMANLTSTYNAADGTWTCTSPLPTPGGSLANGSYEFVARGFDKAGNDNQSISHVTVDYHQIYVWTGATFRDDDPNNDSHSWGTPGNWSPIGIPGINDIAGIDNGDTVQSEASRNVYGLRLINGGLNFTNGPGPFGTLNTSGLSQWGFASFNGIWNNLSGANLDLLGSSNYLMVGGSKLENSGTVNRLTGGNYFQDQSPGGVVIDNLAGGVFNLAGNTPPFDYLYGGNVFNNAGTFKRTGGTATTSIHSWVFNNTGSILSETSALQFDGVLNLDAGGTLGGTSEIHLNGTTNVNAPITLPGTASLTGGTLNCPGGVAIGGNFQWSDGTVNGQFNIPSGAVLNLGGGAIKRLAATSVINNSGTIVWNGQGGYLQDSSPGGVTINNLAGSIFDLAADGSPFDYLYGGNVFNNAGTFKRTGGTATTSIHSWVFNNTGSILSETSALQFDGVLNLDAGGTLGGTSEIHLNGTTNVNAPITLPGTASLTGGTLNCPGGVTIGGNFLWSDGTVNGQFNIPSGAVLNLGGSAIKRLAATSVINNSGTIVWNGQGGYLQDSSPGGVTINNLAGGIFDLAADGSPFDYLYGGNVFNNAGTFKRSGGTATTSIHAWVFNNSNVIRCDTAVLQFDGTLNLTPGTSFAGAGLINLHGTTNSTTATLAIPNTLTFNGGSLNCLGGTTMTGTFAWTGGYLNGLWNVAAGATFNLSGPTIKQMDAGTVITNAGTMNWDGGYLQDKSPGGCTITNLAGATYNLTTDGSPFEILYGGNVFNNAGTFARTGGTNPIIVHAWAMTNTGLIRCGTSVLQFDSTLTLDSGTALGGPGSIKLNGTTNSTTATLAIPSTVTLTGGSLNCPSGTTMTGTFAWTGGYLNGLWKVAAGATFNLTGPTIKQLVAGSVITNAGTINWDGGYLQDKSPGGFTIDNLAGATFNLTADGSPFEIQYGGDIFNNSGLLVKSSGTASANLHAWHFTNSGTLAANTGDIVLDGGQLDLLGGGILTGAKTFRFTGGSASLKGTTMCSGNAIFGGTPLTGDADGTGTLAGGRWDWSAGTFSGPLATAPSASLFVSGTGNPQLGSGAVFENAGGFTVENSGTLVGNGTSTIHNLTGGTFLTSALVPFTNYYGGNSFINDGNLVIGGSPGQWSLDWDFTQSATGNLNVDVAGPGSSDFDQIAVGGTATLGGRVNVTKLGGYAPAAGTTFAFLKAAAISGTFATVNGGFAADYTATSASLRAVAGLTYETWIAATGLVGSDALRGADPDGDGMTNFAEFAFNTNPRVANASPVSSRIADIGGQKWLILSYRRWDDREAAGLVYTPQTSAALISWSPVGVVDEADAAGLPVAGSAAWRCRIPVNSGKAFLRVAAVQP